MKQNELENLIEIIIRRYLVPITGQDMHAVAADFNNKIKRDDSHDDEPIVFLDDSELDNETKPKNDVNTPYMNAEDEQLEDMQEMEDLSKNDLYNISSADNMQLRYKNWDVKRIDYMGDEEEDDDVVLESLDIMLDFIFDNAICPNDKDTRHNDTSELKLVRDVENPITDIKYFDDDTADDLTESKIRLTEYGNFEYNAKYTDWSDFKNRLKNAISTGFKTIDELLDLMKMDKTRYDTIVHSMIYNWKDSVSKSLLHTIAHIGLQLPKKGDNIFKDLLQQTRFILIAGKGISQRDLFGGSNGINGLNYLSLFGGHYSSIKNPKYNIGAERDTSKYEKFIQIGGINAMKINEPGLDTVNEIIQHIWLYAFYQHWKLKKEKIKLPKVLYRGIRISNLWNQKTIKPLIAQIWKKDGTHEMLHKEAMDIVINTIINKGLTKLADGQLLSFTASKPIASYFTNGEGFIVQIDPTKVEIVTSEKTDPLFDQPDFVSDRKEREYIVKIPSSYKFKREDIIIEDLDYLVAEVNPLSVQFFDHDNKTADYDLDGHHVQAYFSWNSSGTKGSLLFRVDDKYYESRGSCKKKYKFDPLPTEENISRVTNFTIKPRKSW